MKNFKSKVAIITGAGSGIGQALALNLAKQGCQLALSDVNTEGLEKTLNLIQRVAPNIKVKVYLLDVANCQNFKDHANEVMIDFSQVDLLINNAGVALSSTLDNTKREDFEWLMNINFWGVVNGTEAFLPFLKKSDDGHIVNISSVFGMISVPTQGAYNAAKFAVRGYTEALMQDLTLSESSVNVSCVHPGGIATNIAKVARVSEGDDREKMAADFDKLAHTTPEKAAQIILKGVLKNKPRIMVGLDAHFIHIISRLLGIRYRFMTQWLAKKTL